MGSHKFSVEFIEYMKKRFKYYNVSGGNCFIPNDSDVIYVFTGEHVCTRDHSHYLQASTIARLLEVTGVELWIPF